jgi:hypothetical protein
LIPRRQRVWRLPSKFPELAHENHMGVTIPVYVAAIVYAYAT